MSSKGKNRSWAKLNRMLRSTSHSNAHRLQSNSKKMRKNMTRTGTTKKNMKVSTMNPTHTTPSWPTKNKQLWSDGSQTHITSSRCLKSIERTTKSMARSSYQFVEMETVSSLLCQCLWHVEAHANSALNANTTNWDSSAVTTCANSLLRLCKLGSSRVAELATSSTSTSRTNEAPQARTVHGVTT